MAQSSICWYFERIVRTGDMARTLTASKGSPRSRSPFPKSATSLPFHVRFLYPITDTICYKCEEDPQGVKSVWPEIRTSKEPWFADLFPDFRVVPSSELPKGFVHATTFRSVCINTALYLPWLASQCLKRGVVFRRGIVNHVKDTVPLHHSGQNATVVVNCTGLFSARLGGVEDSTVHPIRGQIVVVRNDPEIMCDTSSSEDGPEEMTYIMHRAAGRSKQSRHADIAHMIQEAGVYLVDHIKRTIGSRSPIQALLFES